MPECPFCREEINEGVERCPFCGEQLLKQCPFCAELIKAAAKKCRFCGEFIQKVPRSIENEAGALFSPSEQKSRLAAGLFGILLGSLGIHRFYLGYTAIGILQIVVTFVTFGIGGIWGFIEGILILAGGFDKDAQGRPLKGF